MDGNNLNKPEIEKWRSRAIILRAPDDVFLQLLHLVETTPNCCFVYQKSSDQKLVVTEVPF